MRVCGFSIVRNAVRFDYPFLESVRSALPLVDEFILAVGASEDETLERARTLDPRKVRIVETVWDDSLREGGAVLAQQTNLALAQVSADWALYLQADEVLHERDHPAVLECMRRYREQPEVEGLLFSYRHFYGSYAYVGTSRNWYRREVRVVRPGVPGLASWRDAQGFRASGRKLRVKPCDAAVYHYGWVRSPFLQQRRLRSFHRLWHPDAWIEERMGGGERFGYTTGGRLERFVGSHPAVMRERIAEQDWNFEYDPSAARPELKDRLLGWFERRTGIRIGEYRNYRLC